MRLTPLRASRLLAAVSAAAAVTFTLATSASASEPERFEGNIEWNWDNACSVGGLTGTAYTQDQFVFTGGEDTQDLDITGIKPAGVTITGVVVKGSNAYYVYLADDLGALPWNDLKAPVNKGGNVADISHWYACGVKDQTPSSSSSSSSTSSSSVTHSSTPSSSETTPSSSEVAATTTTTAAAGPATDNLASTGFGSAWLVGLGAALLAAGAAVLLVLRRRRA